MKTEDYRNQPWPVGPARWPKGLTYLSVFRMFMRGESVVSLSVRLHLPCEWLEEVIRSGGRRKER